jgi:hypothetical protein
MVPVFIKLGSCSVYDLPYKNFTDNCLFFIHYKIYDFVFLDILFMYSMIDLL